MHRLKLYLNHGLLPARIMALTMFALAYTAVEYPGPAILKARDDLGLPMAVIAGCLMMGGAFLLVRPRDPLWFYLGMMPYVAYVYGTLVVVVERRGGYSTVVVYCCNLLLALCLQSKACHDE